MNRKKLTIHDLVEVELELDEEAGDPFASSEETTSQTITLNDVVPDTDPGWEKTGGDLGGLADPNQTTTQNPYDSDPDL